jgi:hypothetical protein
MKGQDTYNLAAGCCINYRILTILYILSCSCISKAQVNYLFPDLFFGNFNTNTGAVYVVPGNIVAPQNAGESTIIDPQNQFYLRCGTSISLNPGFVATPISAPNSFFVAEVKGGGSCDLVIVNSLDGTVGKHEMIELGVKLPLNVNQAIANFLENGSQFPKINPFNPDYTEADYIDVVATFTSPGGNIIEVPGFYYEDYISDQVNEQWIDQPTDYNFRIRFAPNEIGIWTVSVGLYNNIESVFDLTIDPMCSTPQITCIPSDKRGNLEIGNDNRHLRFHDDHKSFFALGRNIMQRGDFEGDLSLKTKPSEYQTKLNTLIGLGEHGGNYIGMQNTSFNFDPEWEHLGVYDRFDNDALAIYNRQAVAWECDRFLKAAEDHNIYIQWAFPSSHYKWENESWAADIRDLWPKNPYHLSTITDNVNPIDFFQSNTSKKYYKRKLRYIMARWGFSPQIAVFEILSEVDPIINSVGYSVYDTWYQEMTNYLKELDYNTKLYMASSSSPMAVALFSSDFRCAHKYLVERSMNHERFDITNQQLFLHNKPFLFGEMGADSELNIAIDYCGNRNAFHNALWSTAFMGGLGAGLEWWYDYDEEMLTHFDGISSFFHDVDFESQTFLPTKWRNTPFGNWSLSCGHPTNYTLENFELVTQSGHRAMGWVHNATAYYGNIPSCNGIGAPCDDDMFPTPIPVTGKIKIKGLQIWKTYTYEWFRVPDNTQYSWDLAHSNIFGEVKLDVSEQMQWANDYAYKIYKDGFAFRTDSIGSDTLDCPLDTIFVDGVYEDDSLHLLSYTWYPGEGSVLYGPNPQIVYTTPGNYTAMLVVSDTITGSSDTLIQIIVVPDCNLSRKSTLSSDNNNPFSIKVNPNPSAGSFIAKLIDPETIIKEIYIKEISGRAVDGKFNRIDINSVEVVIVNAEPGMYLLQIIDQNNHIYSQKVSVSR